LTRSYITAYNPVAAEREVNQSAWERVFTRGTKNSSVCCGERVVQILRRDSTACDQITSIYSHTLCRTRGSSTVARCCNGPNNTCAYWLPPTYCSNEPNSSARATNTSSSSSIVSPTDLAHVFDSRSVRSRNGTRSSRVRSGPKTRAMVDSFLIALSREETSSLYAVSSCSEAANSTLSSSIRTAIGKSSSSACIVGTKI